MTDEQIDALEAALAKALFDAAWPKHAGRFDTFPADFRAHQHKLARAAIEAAALPALLSELRSLREQVRVARRPLTEEDEDTISEWCTGSGSVPPSWADEDGAILRMLNALHPGDGEPQFLSMSDLSDDQAKRAQSAVRSLREPYEAGRQAGMREAAGVAEAAYARGKNGRGVLIAIRNHIEESRPSPCPKCGASGGPCVSAQGNSLPRRHAARIEESRNG